MNFKLGHYLFLSTEDTAAFHDEREYARHLATWNAATEVQKAKVEAAKTALLAARLTHTVVEDCWYSCPKSGECCNEGEGDKCNCGADRHNAAIDEAVE